MRTNDMISTRNFANPIHTKIGAATIMQEATPNVGNLLSKCVPLKWDSILIKRIYGLIHKFSRSMNVFSTTFCFSSNCVQKILVQIYLLWPNNRMVVVASIQMLLARRILYIAYFRHYYYDHLLSFIGMCNPEETSCYARPASVIINCNTWLKCWPRRGRTPSCYYQALFTEYADSMTFVWILDVSQLKKRVKQKGFDMNIIASHHKTCATIFLTVGR